MTPKTQRSCNHPCVNLAPARRRLMRFRLREAPRRLTGPIQSVPSRREASTGFDSHPRPVFRCHPHANIFGIDCSFLKISLRVMDDRGILGLRPLISSLSVANHYAALSRNGTRSLKKTQKNSDRGDSISDITLSYSKLSRRQMTIRDRIALRRGRRTPRSIRRMAVMLTRSPASSQKIPLRQDQNFEAPTSAP